MGLWSEKWQKYIPKEESPPTINNPKTAGVPIEVISSEHKGKVYADDLTIINVSENSHQEALYRIDEACRSLDLKLNLQKCVSIFINKGKPKKKSFELLEAIQDQ